MKKYLLAKEALVFLKEEGSLRHEDWIGDFCYIGPDIFFTCGEIGCCEYDYTEQEFLKYFEDDPRFYE